MGGGPLGPGLGMGGEGGSGPEGHRGERKGEVASLQSEYKDVTKTMQTNPTFEERL